MDEVEGCPPLEEILKNISTIPFQILGGGGFSTVYYFEVLGKQYAVKIIPLENEKQIEEFRIEAQNWIISNVNPRLRKIVPVFCESAVIPIETLHKFNTPIDRILNLSTELRNPEKAIAYGFIFTKATDYVNIGSLPRRYEIATQLVDNLIEALEILHKEGYIHGDIKLYNLLIRPDLGVYFIDLAGLCKLPCTRGIPWTADYMPPDFAKYTKRRFHYRTPKVFSDESIKLYESQKKNVPYNKKRKTRVTTQTFPRYTKEMDRYAMGKVILEILDETVRGDTRWSSDSSPEEAALRDKYYEKAYKLFRYPIHIYASEIGQTKTGETKNRRNRTRKRKN